MDTAGSAFPTLKACAVFGLGLREARRVSWKGHGPEDRRGTAGNQDSSAAGGSGV